MHYIFNSLLFNKLINYIITGSENDDGGRYYFRSVLATVPCLLSSHILLSISFIFSIYSRFIFIYILVSHEQFNVQSNYLLLDEC